MILGLRPITRVEDQGCSRALKRECFMESIEDASNPNGHEIKRRHLLPFQFLWTLKVSEIKTATNERKCPPKDSCMAFWCYFTLPRPETQDPNRYVLYPIPAHRRIPFCIFAKRSLNPLHKSLMLGYGFRWSSNPCGITLTGQFINLACCPALKHK